MYKVYGKLPFYLKIAAVNFYGMILNRKRYASDFNRILDKYRENDNKEYCCLDIDKIKEVTEGSSFYSIQDANSFCSLPIITKDTARENYDKIINLNNVDTYLVTSGTTGSAFRMPVSKEFIYNQWAVFWKFRMIHGLKFDDWCAYLMGKDLIAKSRKKPPYWIKSYSSKQLLMSMVHLDRNTIELYLDEIKKCNIKWVHAYPSVLNLFTELVIENGLADKARDLKLSVMTTSSEMMPEYQRNNIESVFGCRVRQLYGLTEGVVNMFECEEGNLHVDESFSYVEFVRENTFGKYYRIVGTHYHNKAFPLVRYDTGDLADYDENQQPCRCGRKSRFVKEIVGREQDVLFLDETAKAVSPDLIFRDTYGIQKVQIVQNRKGHAEFYIVKSSSFTERDEKVLREKIIDFLGRDFQFDLIFQDEVPVITNGKSRFLVNNVE